MFWLVKLFVKIVIRNFGIDFWIWWTIHCEYHHHFYTIAFYHKCISFLSECQFCWHLSPSQDWRSFLKYKQDNSESLKMYIVNCELKAIENFDFKLGIQTYGRNISIWKSLGCLRGLKRPRVVACPQPQLAKQRHRTCNHARPLMWTKCQAFRYKSFS